MYRVIIKNKYDGKILIDKLFITFEEAKEYTTKNHADFFKTKILKC